jgi:hypothetical protein
VSSAAIDVIDAALEQLLRGVAEETSRRRAAEERMDAMERDCAEAMQQACALAEHRIVADRKEAEQRGRMLERTWALGLVQMLLEGLDGGAGVAALESLRRMLEQGPIEATPSAAAL